MCLLGCGLGWFCACVSLLGGVLVFWVVILLW